MAAPEEEADGAAGRLIREARLQSGLSVTSLARMVGTSASHLSAVELGKQEPNMKTMRRVAEALDLILEIGFSERPKRRKGKKR